VRNNNQGLIGNNSKMSESGNANSDTDNKILSKTKGQRDIYIYEFFLKEKGTILRELYCFYLSVRRILAAV